MNVMVIIDVLFVIIIVIIINFLEKRKFMKRFHYFIIIVIIMDLNCVETKKIICFNRFIKFNDFIFVTVVNVIIYYSIIYLIFVTFFNFF